ncbi:YegJ family protein [Comamonas serinivorans]|nr:DUF2314 domain-containing protein [Comamonas serinivorans]
MRHPLRGLAVLGLAACLWASAGPVLAHDEGVPSIVHMADTDPAMQQAFQRARASLPQFLRLVAKPIAGSDAHAVKVGLRHAGGTEYVWLSELRVQGDRIEGVLDNRPAHLPHKAGQRLTVKAADVVDWLYVDAQGRMQGNFSACALLSQEPPAHAKAFKAQYGLVCDDKKTAS